MYCMYVYSIYILPGSVTGNHLHAVWHGVYGDMMTRFDKVWPILVLFVQDSTEYEWIRCVGEECM